jgi:hypothetical protein
MTLARSSVAASSALLLTLLAASPAAAQQVPAPGSTSARPPGAAPARARPPVVVAAEANAHETRGELRELLSRHSPALGGVLKLDPGLLSNGDYLAPYPDLAEFLGKHPEVARDPAFFFEDIDVPSADRAWRAAQADPRIQTINLWRNTVEGAMFFVAFLVVASILMWLIKTLIDYRRWSRLSKVQAEVHNKVLDRFANNEELLTYVQTPAGRKFLESSPIALDPVGPAIAAPVRRILWAVEAGFVVMAGGIGLQFVSGRVPGEIAPMILALGVLGVALGIGFVVAAAVSFLISKRLGLFERPQPVAERPLTQS